jgi:hypothetical protein
MINEQVKNQLIPVIIQRALFIQCKPTIEEVFDQLAIFIDADGNRLAMHSRK